MSDLIDIAIVGPRSEAGRSLLTTLEEGDFPLGRLRLLDLAPDEEETVLFRNRPVELEDVEQFNWAVVRVVFLLGDAGVAEEVASKAVATGALVIDATGAFAGEAGVPVILPELNPSAMPAGGRGLVAIPAAMTSQLALSLLPVLNQSPALTGQAACLLAVSERGEGGMRELARQTGELLNGRGIDAVVFPRQVAFNIVPESGELTASGATALEQRISAELAGLFGDRVRLGLSMVFVPVFYGHTALLTLQGAGALDLAKLTADYREESGCHLATTEDEWPSPVGEVAGSEMLFVGRLRTQPGRSDTVQLTTVADNLRHGTAAVLLRVALLGVRQSLS